MHATLFAPHSVSASVCADCHGSLVTTDDGSLTGFVGELVPCGCAILHTVECGCRIVGWPLNEGFTGWIELTREELRALPDDAPILRPCSEHNTAARTLSRLGVEAAA